MSSELVDPVCKGCVSCQTADQCTGTCNIAQTYCKTEQNSQNGFEFDSCVSSNEIIGPGYFDRDSWNKAIAQINAVFSSGIAPATELLIDTCNNDVFISAAEFNRVSAAANCTIRVTTQAIIYGTYYEKLEEAIANLYYDSSQCATCNTTCNVQYDSCVACNIECVTCNAECGDACCDSPPCDADEEGGCGECKDNLNDCQNNCGDICGAEQEGGCGECIDTLTCNQTDCYEASCDEEQEGGCGECKDNLVCDDTPPCIDINCGDICGAEQEGGCGECTDNLTCNQTDCYEAPCDADEEGGCGQCHDGLSCDDTPPTPCYDECSEEEEGGCGECHEWAK